MAKIKAKTDNKSAQEWLQRWQSEHSKSPKYRAATNTTGLPTNRIPRIIVVTVGSVFKALAGKWGENFATFWNLSPEYAFHIFEDVDCEAFLAACCPPGELQAAV